MSIMKRKKRLVLTALIACLGVFLSVEIYLVAPKFLAGDTQVTDLTLKSQVNEQMIQLTVTDQNQADTKVVVPLAEKLSYTPTKQTNAGITYDQVNHQIVIDWLANHPKTVNLTVKAEQAGTYVFKAQTTRNDTPVNTAPTSVTITPVESTPTSSIQSNNQATLSEKVAVPGLQEPNTTSSQSLATKEATQQQKNSTKDLPDHADTDIVTPADLGNQEWLLEILRKDYAINIYDGLKSATFGDLKKVTDITFPAIGEGRTGEIPEGIQYLTNLRKLSTYGPYLSITGGFMNVLKLKQLEYLEVHSSSNLTGLIPKEISNLSNLTFFDIAGDNFTGGIPVEIGKLKKTSIISLATNDLEGEIPEELADAGGEINLDRNYKLYGLIPSKIEVRQNVSFDKTQVVNSDPQNPYKSAKGDYNDAFDNNTSHAKRLINYVNPAYKNSDGWIKLPLIAGIQKIKIFDKLNANLDTSDKHILNLGLGSRTVTTGDTTPLLSGHTYQITDATGKIVYDGPADPNFTLSPTTKDTRYIIRMDHSQETLTNANNRNNRLTATIVLDIEAKMLKVTQSFRAGDSSVGTDNQVKYIKDKPFKMISTLQNDDELDFKVGKMNEKIKAADKDQVSIDPATFEMQKPNTSSWEAIPDSDVQENADGYQVDFKDINLKPTEKIKLRYSVTAKEAFTDTAVLNHQVLLSNTQELPAVNNDMTIKNGQLLFNVVPGTMGFADSKIANMKTEIKRKLPDWKMQIEDTRLNKTDWHITANLVSELKNSNGDSLGDSVIFKKTGQPNQVINTTNAVDVYDGKSSTADYQDVQWTADAGPTLSIAPGLAKLGSYTGTMQWTLVDAPA